MIRTLIVERMTPFRRWLPSDVYVWTKAVLLALIAIQCARLMWTLLTPVGPFGEWRPGLPQALSAGERAAVFASVDPFSRAQAIASGQPLDTGLQLFGIRSGGGGAAIIATADGEQQSYGVGEEVAPGVTLAAVAFDHVVLKQGGREQKLFMPPPEGIAPAATAAAPAQAAPAAAAQAFALRPRTSAGRVTGALVGAGTNPALLAASGLRDGDVIVAVNGARISSPIDIEQLRSSILPGARLMLSVERGAQTVPVALNIPGNL